MQLIGNDEKKMKPELCLKSLLSPTLLKSPWKAAPILKLKLLWMWGIFDFASIHGAEFILFFQNIAGHSGTSLQSDFTILEEGKSYSLASLGT